MKAFDAKTDFQWRHFKIFPTRTFRQKSLGFIKKAAKKNTKFTPTPNRLERNPFEHNNRFDVKAFISFYSCQKCLSW